MVTVNRSTVTLILLHLICGHLLGCENIDEKVVLQADSVISDVIAADDAVKLDALLTANPKRSSPCDIVINFGSEMPLLHFAAMNDSVNVVKYLLDLGCDPLQVDASGEHPGEIALAHGAEKVIAILPRKYQEISEAALRDYFSRRGIRIRKVNGVEAPGIKGDDDFVELSFRIIPDSVPERISVSFAVFNSGELVGTETGELIFHHGYLNYVMGTPSFLHRD